MCFLSDFTSRRRQFGSVTRFKENPRHSQMGRGLKHETSQQCKKGREKIITAQTITELEVIIRRASQVQHRRRKKNKNKSLILTSCPVCSRLLLHWEQNSFFLAWTYRGLYITLMSTVHYDAEVMGCPVLVPQFMGTGMCIQTLSITSIFNLNSININLKYLE